MEFAVFLLSEYTIEDLVFLWVLAIVLILFLGGVFLFGVFIIYKTVRTGGDSGLNKPGLTEDD